MPLDKNNRLICRTNAGRLIISIFLVLLLSSSKYPIIRFRPERALGKFNSTSPQVITVEGIFQMRGEDHPLQIQMAVRPDGNSYSATTHFTVPLRRLGTEGS
ncbi:MAG TPA: hypothetical protein VK638_17035 [Edaphobacter sp.]|nr:hypothetical protein [Edaphobacter sp.]